jgi:hypothetical protein
VFGFDGRIAFRPVALAGILLGCASGLWAQPVQAPAAAPPEPARNWGGNHMLGVLPAYNVAGQADSKPLTKRQKFRLFWEGTKDPIGFLAVGFEAGIEQANNSNAGYGQGAGAFCKRYAAAWTDATSGRLFRNSIYPILLHEDPRYFRRSASAGFGGRIGYAVSRVLVTRTDSQAGSFNWSKLFASFSSAGLSNLYYPAQNRGVGLTLTNVGIGYGTEAGLNTLKEFWPDLKQHLSRKR